MFFFFFYRCSLFFNLHLWFFNNDHVTFIIKKISIFKILKQQTSPAQSSQVHDLFCCHLYLEDHTVVPWMLVVLLFLQVLDSYYRWTLRLHLLFHNKASPRWWLLQMACGLESLKRMILLLSHALWSWDEDRR